MNQALAHYLAQIDQVRTMAKITVGVDTQWPGLESLDTTYRKVLTEEPANMDEAQDLLAPLRSPESGSDRPRPPINGARRRKSTLGSTPLPPLYSFGFKPWPRRTSLDPSGTTQVDPIRKVELTLDYAHDQRQEMVTRRNQATRQLQNMIGEIDAMVKQKDAVRTWTKSALDQGNSRAKMGRVKDRVYDTLVRSVLSPLFRGVFGVFWLARWAWALKNPASRTNAQSPLSSNPMGVCFFCASLIGLVAFFYYLGE
ncbi:hypothetical protein P7C73_g655, partial [Tremellales sp. Uapishka_1]